MANEAVPLPRQPERKLNFRAVRRCGADIYGYPVMEPVRGGLVSVMHQGTDLPMNVFADRGMIILHANPVILNACGEADIWIPVGRAVTIQICSETGEVIERYDAIT